MDPRFLGGPPIPGAPWARTLPGAQIYGPQGGSVSQARPSAAKSKFVPRLPNFRGKGKAEESIQRISGFMDQVSNIFNSLIRTGQLRQTGQTDFDSIPTALANDRPPTNLDDAAEGIPLGATWVDTSSANDDVYLNTDNTIGAARWKKLADGTGSSTGYTGTT